MNEPEKVPDEPVETPKPDPDREITKKITPIERTKVPPIRPADENTREKLQAFAKIQDAVKLAGVLGADIQEALQQLAELAGSMPAVAIVRNQEAA